MQLILLSKDRGQLGHVRLTSRRVWLGIVAVTLTVAASAFYGGIAAARFFGVSNPQAQVETWRQELAEQQALVDGTRRTLQQSLDALALRIGQLNAHVVRLDALGTRLTQMAGLKDGEFDFTSAPSLGGPEEPLAATEDLAPTPHSKLKVARGRAPEAEWLPRLESWIAGEPGADDAAVRAELAKWVPEYRPR